MIDKQVFIKLCLKRNNKVVKECEKQSNFGTWVFVTQMLT